MEARSPADFDPASGDASTAQPPPPPAQIPHSPSGTAPWDEPEDALEPLKTPRGSNARRGSSVRAGPRGLGNIAAIAMGLG